MIDVGSDSYNGILFHVSNSVIAERLAQDEKWGLQNHSPELWMNILGEEFGEACKSVVEQDWNNYEEELVETAAVACAALESFYRQAREAQDE